MPDDRVIIMSGKILVVSALGLLCGIGFAVYAVEEEGGAGNEIRTWTSTGGQTIEASFESFVCDAVRLKGTNGKSFQIPLSRLVEADQEAVRELARAASASKQERWPVSRSTRSSSGMLSADEVAKLQTEWRDEDGRHSRSFRPGFSAIRLDPKKHRSTMRKYAKSGKVPFKITATLVEGREKNGKKSSSLIKRGTCYIRITDADGVLVTKKSISLAKLCPT